MGVGAFVWLIQVLLVQKIDNSFDTSIHTLRRFVLSVLYITTLSHKILHFGVTKKEVFAKVRMLETGYAPFNIGQLFSGFET